jgi:hypothetical protein
MRTFAQGPKTTQRMPARPATPGRTRLEHGREASILHPQRTIGNQALQRMLRAHAGTPGPAAAYATGLQHKPSDGKGSAKAEACPLIERGESAEAAKAQPRLIERIPQTEWLIYGFPIGGSEISGAEAGGFIADIVKSLMQGHLIYATGPDPLQVTGFSDCLAGPRVDNHALRRLRHRPGARRA